MLEPIRNWWCQKVLPLVYTDALSYYEVLGKLIQKINEVITNVNSLNENTVFTVNDIKPTGGNVNVGTVKSVNGSTPDASGNVNLPAVSGVTSVDGVGADSQGNVQLRAVREVNGYTPDESGVIPGISAVSMLAYISTWNTTKDIYDFAVNSANAKKLFYSSIWGENSYPWWDASLFGSGDFIFTILNLADTHQPEILIRSLERGDIYALHREGEAPNQTYVWRANYGSNVRSINTINKPDANGNVYLSAAGVGAIPNTDGSVSTSNLGSKIVTKAKCEDDILYYPEKPVTITDGVQADASWGRYYMYLVGTGTVGVNFSEDFFNSVESFWECYLINPGLGNVPININTNTYTIFNLTEGTSPGASALFQLANYKGMFVKKLGTVILVQIL